MSSRNLPERPLLEHLRKLAKERLQSARADTPGIQSCRRTIGPSLTPVSVSGVTV